MLFLEVQIVQAKALRVIRKYGLVLVGNGNPNSSISWKVDRSGKKFGVLPNQNMTYLALLQLKKR